MPFIAIKALTIGGNVIDPGAEVPLERGRDYDLMQRAGEILWSDAPATVLEPPAPRAPARSASTNGTKARKPSSRQSAARRKTGRSKAPRKAES